MASQAAAALPILQFVANQAEVALPILQSGMNAIEILPSQCSKKICPT
jgi:hypothetical protein